jgi:hypothetical protein
MILDTVKIDILFSHPEKSDRLIPVEIKTANIDSEDLLDCLRILLHIEGYGSLDPITKPPVILEVDSSTGTNLLKIKEPIKETTQQKLKKLSPSTSKIAKAEILAKNALAPRWSDREMDLLRINPDFKDAWIKYQKEFPESKRNKSTVQQRWNILHPGKKKGKKVPKVEKEVPISTLEKPETDTKGEPSFKQIIKNTVNPPHEPMIEGSEDLVDQMPDEPTASRLEIRKDVKVKQIGGTKICAGIGTVKRCPNGKDEVLVAFDNGMEWIERKNLTVVPV